MGKYIKEELEKKVKESKSIADVIRKYGLNPVGSNYVTIKRYIKLFNIDTSHFYGKNWNRGLSHSEKTARYKLNEITKNGIIFSSHGIKKRLIENGIKEHKCEKCGNVEWEGQPIPLELHHINGNHYDNRIDNLQLLCPNCHAQTYNYRGRKTIKNETSAVRLESKRYGNICEHCGKNFNSSKKQRFCSIECYHDYIKKRNSFTCIDENTLKNEVKNYKNIKELADHFNTSRTTIRKHLIKYNLYDEFKEKFDFNAHKVKQYDLNNNFIKEWGSISDAESTLKIFGIDKCCKGKRRSCGGFLWRYA